MDSHPPTIPDYFLRSPLLGHNIKTQTTEVQEETLEECLPLLNGINDPTRSPFEFNDFGVPELRIHDHVDFLHENLAQFPAQFVGLDASRPWMVYWGLLSLHLLGEDVTILRDRYVLLLSSQQLQDHSTPCSSRCHPR